MIPILPNASVWRMRPQRPMVPLAWWAAVILSLLPLRLPGQSSAAPARYTLIDGAALTDDCPICGRPALVLPLRGTFDMQQTNGTPLQQLALELAAAPFHELWFSTNHGMTSGTTPPPFVHGNLDLVRAFSPLEDLADFGLDALVLVTDADPALPPPVVTGLQLRPLAAGIRLE